MWLYIIFTYFYDIRSVFWVIFRYFGGVLGVFGCFQKNRFWLDLSHPTDTPLRVRLGVFQGSKPIENRCFFSQNRPKSPKITSNHLQIRLEYHQTPLGGHRNHFRAFFHFFRCFDHFGCQNAGFLSVFIQKPTKIGHISGLCPVQMTALGGPGETKTVSNMYTCVPKGFLLT